MRGSDSPFNRRRDNTSTPSRSVGLRTPEHFSSSANSTNNNSATSSTSNNSNSSAKNVVSNAARTVAGAFSACFTSPDKENKVSNHYGDTDLYKTPTDTSSGSSGKRRTQNRGLYATTNNSLHSKELGNVRLTMADICKATRNFSPSLKIGQGGFGTVYKGDLEDGNVVAIKRAKKIMYDKHQGQEFKSEVQTLSQVEHTNLVKLYGYLEHEDERILVAEYVRNGNLREHLDGMQGNILSLAARLQIAIDVAHAVTYLHTYADHPIIHRDIKSSNILLTDNLRAKVADFGFARLVTDNESGDTHVSTQVKGTAGYLDPEYLRTYQLTDKSDVYSFGVLLVELVTGRRPIEPKREHKDRVTPKWAMKKFAEGNAISVLDPRLKKSEATNLALETILELALQCLAPHRRARPTMQKCAEILWSIRKEYKELATSDNSLPSSKSQRGS